MALYLVGDIQGCFDELQLLLEQVQFDPAQDQLWLAGDLVARGPKSLETLRFVKSLGNSANFVLGNHDLHLLAVHAGIKKSKAKDLLADLINAPDFNGLMHWLAQHPLLLELPDKSAFMSHAGISPQWTLDEAKVQARLAQQKISSPERKKWLNIMYGEKPNQWHLAESDEDKFRYTINSLTRMRFVYEDGSLDFNCKDSLDSAPKNLQPWFELSPTLEQTKWVFGHWAALMGKHNHKQLFALDTGCVWGNYLTLLRWDDKKLFTQSAL